MGGLSRIVAPPVALAAALTIALAAGLLVMFVVAAGAQSVATPAKSAAEATGPGARVAYDAALGAKGNATTLKLDFDGQPDYRVFFMENPERLVLELDGAVFRFKDDAGLKAAGLVAELRYGRVSQEKSRLVANLAGPAKIARKTLEKSADSERRRLTIVLEPVAAEAFRRQMADQRALIGSSGEVVIKGDRVRPPEKKAGRFRIVIDPGHGGIDGGATGKSGTLEKELTLEVSKLLGAAIEKAGPFDVYYTREKDVFVSLAERQNVARRHQADLMISIHADSLRQKYVRGATIYTLARRASDALAEEIAESENLADLVAGLAAPAAQDTVTDILADLTLRETKLFSRNFSDRLVDRLEDNIRLINNPQRSASFRVLKNAEVPGVLLELGYLSNKDDETLMRQREWQQKLVRHVADAVRDFFAPRMPLNPAYNRAN